MSIRCRRGLGPVSAAFIAVLGGCTASRAVQSTSTPSTAGNTSSIATEIDRYADSLINALPVAGMSIVVKRGSSTIVKKGYGVIDIATGRRATDTSSYRIGSITKTFTALAVLRLVEQGRLKLDDPIDKYLGGLPVPGVTIRHALNHTSGLPDHEGVAVEQWLAKRVPITREFVEDAVRKGPSRAVGQTWDYNNAGFHLLGLVIEKISGESYASFVKREISDPLQLRATWIGEESPAMVDVSLNYLIVDGVLRPDSLWDLPGIFSAGGMFSSASDLAVLLAATAESRVFQRSTIDQMTRATMLPGGVRADYGLGVRLGILDGHRKWGHTGSARSTRSAAAYYPDDALIVVVLMNTEHEDIPVSAIDIEGRIARLVLGLGKWEQKDLPLSAAKAGEYAGTYADSRTQSRIRVSDGSLTLSRVGSTSPPLRMLYQGREEWVPDSELPAFRFVFQRLNEKPAAISRYDNGWFVGVRPLVH